MNSKVLLLITLLTLLSYGKDFSQITWENAYTKNGVIVHKEKIDDNQIVTYKGTTIINAPFDTILEVLFNADFELRKSWENRIQEINTTYIPGTQNRKVYLCMDLPWPMSDREFYYLATLKHEGQKVVISYSSIEGNRPKKEGYIRGKLKSAFYLERIANSNKTRITVINYSNPQGTVSPTWVNTAQKSFPYNILSNVKKESERRVSEQKLSFAQ